MGVLFGMDCEKGKEMYQDVNNAYAKKAVQYVYRSRSGRFYCCVAESLRIARSGRNKWLLRQIQAMEK